MVLLSASDIKCLGLGIFLWCSQITKLYAPHNALCTVLFQQGYRFALHSLAKHNFFSIKRSLVY